MTNWTKGTALDAEAEQELLNLIRGGGDVALTVTRDESRPTPMRYGIVVDKTTAFGATFAEAWHGQKMEVGE